MKLLRFLPLLAHGLAVTAEQVYYSGFCYGSHWDLNTPKNYSDFRRGFEDAKKIKAKGVTFDSARLFSSLQWNSNELSEAFQAAIDTNTTLLLGIWIGATNTDAELAALDKAFEQHGEHLANLVVGISVGSEDIYRDSDCRAHPDSPSCGGAANKSQVISNVTYVRDHFNRSPYAELLKDKPIGHVDVAREVLEESVDFVGTTLYPFWNSDAIDGANSSLERSMGDIKGRAGGTPVWIAETGWPIAKSIKGKSMGAAEPTLENMERYWKEVGCSLFGKTNVWWFELESDTYQDDYDWAVIDYDRKPRFDFTCDSPNGKQQQTPSTFITLPTSSKQSSPPSTTAAEADIATSTISPTDTASKRASSTSKGQTTLVVTQTECATIALFGSGQTTTITTNTFFTSMPCASPPPVTLDERQAQIPLGPTRSATSNAGKTTSVSPAPTPPKQSSAPPQVPPPPPPAPPSSPPQQPTVPFVPAVPAQPLSPPPPPPLPSPAPPAPPKSAPPPQPPIQPIAAPPAPPLAPPGIPPHKSTPPPQPFIQPIGVQPFKEPVKAPPAQPFNAPLRVGP